MFPLLKYSIIPVLGMLLTSCSGTDRIPVDCEECEGDHTAYIPVTAPIVFDRNIQSYRGTAVIGKNMQTFQPDGTSQLFWMDAADSPEVRGYFERVMRVDSVENTPYKPRRITLRGYFKHRPLLGPASKCDGVFVTTGMY